MKMFAAIVTSVPDMLERRQPYRADHLDGLKRMQREGKLVTAGAWADPVDGALLIFQAESKEDVEQWVKADPYCKAGLWPEFTVREWNVVIK